MRRYEQMSRVGERGKAVDAMSMLEGSMTSWVGRV